MYVADVYINVTSENGPTIKFEHPVYMNTHSHSAVITALMITGTWQDDFHHDLLIRTTGSNQRVSARVWEGD